MLKILFFNVSKMCFLTKNCQYLKATFNTNSDILLFLPKSHILQRSSVHCFMASTAGERMNQEKRLP